MDRQIDFTKNFEKALREIFGGYTPIDFKELRFKLIPVDEINKPNDLGGDWLIQRAWIREKPDFEHKLWTIDETINLLCTTSNYFPLWIEIEKKAIMI